MLNMFSGGALSRASILALGIMPYISASIVMQLFATVSSCPSRIEKKVQQDKEKSPSIPVMQRWFCYHPSNRYFYRFTEYVATASAKYRFYFTSLQ